MQCSTALSISHVHVRTLQLRCRVYLAAVARVAFTSPAISMASQKSKRSKKIPNKFKESAVQPKLPKSTKKTETSTFLAGASNNNNL